MERLTNKKLCKCTNSELYCKQLDIHKIYNKLAEFEDFMEENNLTLKRFKTVLRNVKTLSKIGVYFENDRLRARWDILKEFVKECKEEFEQYENMDDIACGYRNTLEKMEELEGEIKCHQE